jgi:dihydroorotate dehydrogenase electron transfer subunit
LRITKTPITSIEKINYNTFLIGVEFSKNIEYFPGQFFNIKVSETDFPLLRRPFSICDAVNNTIYFLFSIYGIGTDILSQKKIGDNLDLVGPLGNGFNYVDNYDYAILVAGGIGVAPFPFLLRKINNSKQVKTFVGARSKEDVITYGLENPQISTDDGTFGFHGNVVELLEDRIDLRSGYKYKIFACGPNQMLRAIKNFAHQHNILCEISTESVMACGFGICQGCPIKATDKEGFYLICQDGPVFEANKVIV